MWINGRDPADDSWQLTGISGWMQGFGLQRGVTAIPNIGGVIPASQYTAEPRSINLTFRRYLTALSDRDAALYTLQERLRGKLWCRFNDATTRVVRCVAGPLTVQAANERHAFAIATIVASVTLTAYDGASYDSEPRILALATTPVEIPLGTLPSAGILYWGGAWTATTSRTLILRDAGGVARFTATFTAPAGESLGATDYLEVDIGRRYVTKVTSAGVRTNEYEWYTGATSSNWLDPAFQDLANTRYSTLEISAGTAQFLYRKAYAL